MLEPVREGRLVFLPIDANPLPGFLQQSLQFLSSTWE
jgi:hypothetical protein